MALNFKEGAKRGATEILAGAAYTMVRPKLVELLEAWTPDKVAVAIREGVNLFKDVDLSQVKGQVVMYRSIITKINPETVLLWIEKLRPDLTKRAEEEEGGREWFLLQVSTLRSRLLE